MIQLYSGVPGAGKTYKMVEDLDAFLVKNPEVNLVANIRGLKLPHQNFDDLLAEYFSDKSLTIPQKIEKFFDYDFQAELNEKFGGPIMYVLDECQLYFPRRTSLPNTEAYLQRHRHLGHYLYLATQSSKLINSNIVALIEVEFYAVRRSISLFGEMHYRVKSPQSNQIISKKVVKPSKKIFRLYKSFEAEEITKPKRELLKKLWPLIFLPIGAFFFYDRVLNVDKKVQRLTGNLPAKQSSPVSQTTGAAPGMVPAPLPSPPSPPAKERVFLTVVLTDGKKMTIDPETRAYVEVKQIAHRVLCAGEDGLICYYDREVAEAIKFAGADEYSSPYSTGANSPYPGGIITSAPQPAKAQAGEGAFITPEIVPEADNRFRWSHVEY